MEIKIEVEDIISTDGKRKRDGSDSYSDSEFEEKVFPSRNRQRILPDDEDEYTIEDCKIGIIPNECVYEDCKIGLIPNEWVWKDTENITKIWIYSRTSKINVPLGQSVTVLEMINEILTEDFWQIIVTETNRYASLTLRNETHKLKKYEDNWRDTNIDEIKAYFALCILMSQVKKNSLQSYWSKRSIIETPIFRKIMPFWRFSQLSRFLYFSNDDGEDHNNDRLCKLRSVIDYFNKKFETIYTPEEDLSLDESLMKYTGRMAYKQYNPSKRVHSGVKFYKLCESKSGYCIQFKICTGQDINKNANESASESVTMFMCKTISGYGHTLFLNNWYSSPSLFAKLQSIKTNAIGMVRCNGKDMPKELAAEKLKRSDVISRSSNGILVARWKDKEDIYVMSTKHSKVEMEEVEKKGRKSNNDPATKPNIVLEYNNGMGGVDLQDSHLSSFSLMRKFVESYKKIFFHIADIALFNSYVLFCKKMDIAKSKRFSFPKFRLDVAEQLLQAVRIPDYKKRGAISVGSTPTRLEATQWGHFPRNIPPTSSKKNPQRRCRVCTKHKRRSETVWECKKCLVPLHVPDCFERFHTLRDY